MSSDLYTVVDGEPMIGPKGMSLLLGVPLRDIFAESKRSNGEHFTLPAEWIKSGRRRSKEYQAATGQTDMLGALEYWQAKEQERM
ncbi:hypothetical protein [Rhodococcus aetherivorans]|uniref:hypothetical protein n=1 Tax=Rhodococcus aetherivorans TaxID=191292 RepID=UPI00241F2EAF|nr:hypothetical protein [Rhodococcus aetherivorans]WFS11851.1 hypothetical protein P9K37_18830 [Rhodococcus aetherivorans]